jgi:cytochrome c peroxidase
VLVATTVAAAERPAASEADRRIGEGDPRAGYERRDFETRSRGLAAFTGVPANLARLAADPPLGLPPLADPPARELIDLGRRLFFDRRLSANETISCAMCHVPEQAFTQNELATPVGIEGRFVRRNAPALYNVAYQQTLFHDGRENSLEAQIWSPLLAANEMGNPDRQTVLGRVAADPDYLPEFADLFPDGLGEAALGEALAAYQRALLSAESPFDRWFFGGDRDAVSESARQGFFLFNEAGCARCHRFSHREALFTDHGFHRTGVEHASRRREANPPTSIQVAPGVAIPLSVSVPAPDRNDEGRMEVTGSVDDRWRYRTPMLRNVAITGPYMHDGSLATLSDVLAFYGSGSGADPERDPLLAGLILSADEQQAIVAFLESLTGANVDALAADARIVPIGDRPAGEPP